MREEIEKRLKSRRDYATAARTVANKAKTEEAGAVFLRIAAEWEKEIYAIQNGTLHPAAKTPRAPIKLTWSLSYLLNIFSRQQRNRST